MVIESRTVRLNGPSLTNDGQFTKKIRPTRLQLDLHSIPEDHQPPDGIVLASTATNHSQNVPLNVGFRNLSCTVPEGLFKRRPKLLLRAVNGEFRGGELTAIMGPSGAGKTTLMNILAGYTKTGVQGDLLSNGDPRETNTFRKQSCYIMQDDKLQPLLTVHEAMTIAAHLKLNGHITNRERTERIQEILESFHLWQHCNVKTQCLSGGQKKRLAIALELLTNPQVMFFDEPTSGLDSLSSKQCVLLLKDIAASGRTIICTIHQPSAIIFEMFDHLYALAAGKCIYQGAVKGLASFLGASNLVCPPYHNPADYLLEVASRDYGDYTDELSTHCDNGKNDEYRKNPHDSWYTSNSCQHMDDLLTSGQITPVQAPPMLFLKKITKSNIFHPTTIRQQHHSALNCYTGQYAVSFWTQICVLLRRTFLLLSRDRTLTYSRLTTHFGIAVFIGTLYYGIGLDASNMLNNFNFLFFSVMFLMLTAFNCVSTTFPSELPIITREHFNKWYSLESYYLAITLADIPIQMIATLIYAVITYLMTMQPVEAYRIFSFLFMCVLISLVAQSWGLLIGASMDVKNGVIFGPFCFLPFTIFSGFFVQLSNAHPYIRWLFHISFLKYGFEGLVLSVLGYNREKLPCKEADYCHFVYPAKFLSEMDMSYAKYSTAVVFLVSLIAIIRIVAYFALSIQIKCRKS